MIAFFFGGTGIMAAVRVTMLGGGDPVVLPMLVGIPLPARVIRVWSGAETTATGIVGVK